MSQQSAPPEETPYFDKIKTIWFDFFEGRLSASARDMQLQPFRELLTPLSPAHNFLMLQTSQAKELSVAEAVDRLVGVDSSYCPMYYRDKAVSVYTKARRVVAIPLIPRLIFCTASFPRHDEIMAIHGAEGFIRNPWGEPEVVPGWEMALFQQEIEKTRLWCLRMAERANIKPKKAPKFNSFAELKAWFAKNNQGESIDENGEILISSQAA